METYLLTWNPKISDWSDTEESIKNIEKSGSSHGRWSCGVTKKILPDDQVFLIKLGEEPQVS